MMHQILVPLDGSTSSERVLPLARRLALAGHATVHLVRVIAPPLSLVAASAYVSQSVYDTIVATDERTAWTYLEEARMRLAACGLKVRLAVLTGEIAPQLLLYEREQGIDLIALGLRRHSGPSRLALGSVAAFLLRHGSAPLLVACGPADPSCLSHAVVPLDGSAAHEQVLNVVLGLAPVVQHVSLLRVVAQADQELPAMRYLTGIAERLGAQGLHVEERHVAVGSAAPAIGELAKSGHLVIMATHAHVPPTHWLTSSVADRVVHLEPAVVLLVRTGTALAAPLPTEHGAGAQGT